MKWTRKVNLCPIPQDDDARLLVVPDDVGGDQGRDLEPPGRERLV